MAKSRTSGARVSGLNKGFPDVNGLTFKAIPKTTRASVENASNIRGALRQGKTLILRNDETGKMESYTLNKDMTFTVKNNQGVSRTVSYEDGGNSWASWMLNKKGRSFAIK